MQQSNLSASQNFIAIKTNTLVNKNTKSDRILHQNHPKTQKSCIYMKYVGPQLTTFIEQVWLGLTMSANLPASKGGEEVGQRSGLHIPKTSSGQIFRAISNAVCTHGLIRMSPMLQFLLGFVSRSFFEHGHAKCSLNSHFTWTSFFRHWSTNLERFTRELRQ